LRLTPVLIKLGLVFFARGAVLARRCALPMLAAAVGAGAIYGFLTI
jgi:hypothetical protein